MKKAKIAGSVINFQNAPKLDHVINTQLMSIYSCKLNNKFGPHSLGH